MNITYKFGSLLGLLLFGQLLQAQDLLYPRLRDESIANTTIAVTTKLLPSGIYEYTYTLNSSNDNRGRILTFSLGINCEAEFDESAMPIAKQTRTYSGDDSNGLHVPIVFDFSESQYAFFHGIGPDNTADWLVAMNPGETVAGLRILSPAPPQQIPYRLKPSMDTEGWDYGSYEEMDPTVPWIEDFTVTGMAEGPGCPLEVPPSKGEFVGSGHEPKNINQLLTYSAPELTPIELNGNTVTVVVHYDKLIEEGSFSARLNGKDVSSLFTPKANSKETVIITSDKWPRISRLRLAVKGITQGNERGKSFEKRPDKSHDNPSQQKSIRQLDEHKSKDVDVFHIYNF